MKRFYAVVILCVCVFALAAVALTGCSGNASSLTSEQQANRTYMSKVNEIMNQLGDQLDSFVDAVSRNDVVNMHTQSENAFTTLDQLSKLEAPEALADVHKKYIDGAGKMREALQEYIDLYTEIDAGSLDQSTYNKRIADVQSKYDEGVSMLKEADEAAASKQ